MKRKYKGEQVPLCNSFFKSYFSQTSIKNALWTVTFKTSHVVSNLFHSGMYTVTFGLSSKSVRVTEITITIELDNNQKRFK